MAEEIEQKVKELRPKYLPTSDEMDLYERNIISLLVSLTEAHKVELADEYARGFNDGANQQYKIINEAL